MSLATYREWSDARQHAQREANLLQRPMAVEKANEYGRIVYRVAMLPKLEKDRFGWETRCEVVNPDS